MIVGFHRDFDYERLRIASGAVRDGARLLATNDDATYPTPEGLIPGGGAILAAVATASAAAPTIAGKPYAPMAALVRDRCGPEFNSETAVMVGDRWSTDGLFAEALGLPVRARAHRSDAAGCAAAGGGGARSARPRCGRRRDHGRALVVTRKSWLGTLC